MLNVELSELMDYEAGDLSPEQVLDLFQRLVDGGLVRCLASHYAITAEALINAGLIAAPDAFDRVAKEKALAILAADDARRGA